MDVEQSKPNPSKRGHPLLADRAPGVWHPDLVGRVPGYPKTQEAHDRRMAALERNRAAARAAGKLHRRGVPNGWAGRKGELRNLKRRAAVEAEETIAAMHATGVLDPNATGDEAFGDQAIMAAVEMVRDITQPASIRLMAMRLVVAFTKPAPTGRRAAVTLEGGLEFLAGLAAEAKRKGG